jgi:hypothetical protein
MTTAAAIRLPLTLHVEGKPALAEALAASINPGYEFAWTGAALLICRRETAALVRLSLASSAVQIELAAHHPQGTRVRVHWVNHLREHPHVVSCPLEDSWVHLLVVPRCSLVDHLRAFSCPYRIIMGRSREELLRNAYRCLMALSPFPLHPSWEEPVMRSLLAVADRSQWPPLRLFPESDVLQFALLDIAEATEEVEQLWRARALPVPDAA